jgi:hypothetical protein
MRGLGLQRGKQEPMLVAHKVYSYLSTYVKFVIKFAEAQYELCH